MRKANFEPRISGNNDTSSNFVAQKAIADSVSHQRTDKNGLANLYA